MIINHFSFQNDREVSVNGNNEGDWGEWSLDCATGICGVQVLYIIVLKTIGYTFVPFK